MSGLLEVKELAVHFPSAHGTIKAIDGVSLSLQEGETLGIAGESGSGKSMTALALLGLIPKPGKVVHGEIIFEGENLEQNSERQMRRLRGRKLAMILQDPMTSLNPAPFHRSAGGRELRHPSQAGGDAPSGPPCSRTLWIFWAVSKSLQQRTGSMIIHIK